MTFYSFYYSYFYTGTVSWEKMKRNDIAAILSAADELQLPDLVNYIQEELIANHTTYITHHLLDLYQTSSSLKSCQKLCKYCQETIAASPDLLDSQEFNKLEHDSLKSLLMQDGLALPEIVIWNKVIAWGIANTNGLTADIESWRKDDF